jgi:hypothetical protein
MDSNLKINELSYQIRAVLRFTNNNSNNSLSSMNTHIPAFIDESILLFIYYNCPVVNIWYNPILP